MDIVNITDYLNTNYKDYCKYCVETRSLPSFDGLRVGARKMLYGASKTIGVGNMEKVTNFIGAGNKMEYAHGEASLGETIISLGQEFIDNACPLFIDGSYGSLRSPKGSSPRYLSAYLNENFDKFYNIDTDLLKLRKEGDDLLEPLFYLPIIPLVLAKRGSGIAPAFSFKNNMSFTLKSIAEMTLGFLEERDGMSYNDLESHVEGYNGEIYRIDKYRWKTVGAHTFREDWLVEVNEFALGETYQSFQDNLMKLEDKGYVQSWEDHTYKGDVNYQIELSTDATYESLNDMEKVLTKLKIMGITHKPNLCILLPRRNGSVVPYTFDTPEELISGFVQWRLPYFEDRRKLLINDMEKRVEVLTEVIRFVQMVVDGDLDIMNRKKKDIRSEMKELAFKNITDCLSLPIYRLTEDEIGKNWKEIASSKKELEKLKKSTAEKLFKSDLKALIKTL